MAKEPDIKVAITVGIPESMIDSLLVDAPEAIHYWGEIYEKNHTLKELKFIGPTKIQVHEDMGAHGHKMDNELTPDKGPIPKGTRRILTYQNIVKGLEIMADKYPFHFCDILNQNTDSTTADVFIQLAIFSDIVFS